jgi:hypothetical protein
LKNKRGRGVEGRNRHTKNKRGKGVEGRNKGRKAIKYLGELLSLRAQWDAYYRLHHYIYVLYGGHFEVTIEQRYLTEDSREKQDREDRKKTRPPPTKMGRKGKGKECEMLPSSSVNLSAWLEG